MHKIDFRNGQNDKIGQNRGNKKAITANSDTVYSESGQKSLKRPKIEDFMIGLMAKIIEI